MKKLFLKTILPTLLLIGAVLIIGSGCSGPADGQSTFWPDLDGDGYGDNSVGNGSIYNDNDFPPNYVTNRNDCDDTNAAINIDATEVPGNLIDENCDDKLAFTFYKDSDGDGFGDKAVTEIIEVDSYEENAPNGFSWVAGDCNDQDPAINPLAEEIAGNGIDDNCDGETDIVEHYKDADGDGYGSTEFSSPADGVTNNLDCDDTNNEIHPYRKEIFNDGMDSNCDGSDNS